MNKGTVIIERFQSDALRNNPLGDPSERSLAVYLPPGYEHSDRRYPVIVMLSSFMGFGTMYLSPQAWGYSLDERCDVLIGEGTMKPCILVMPDCFTRWGGSQYVNSPALGRYEDYVIREIIPWVDGRFRTLNDPSHRAVAGKSSGGYGALRLSMSHPDVFGTCYCGAGDMYFEYGYKPDIPKCHNALKRWGGLDGFFEAFFAAPKKSGDMIAAMNIIAMSAAYSPNAGAPHGFDLPFDPATGELRHDVWNRWLAFDPVQLLENPAMADNLRKLKLLYLDCGSRDEYQLHIGAAIFANKLNRLAIPHVYETFDDGHMGTSYRYHHVLPKLADAVS